MGVVKTKSQLHEDIDKIRKEQIAGQNTKKRVSDVLDSIVDSMGTGGGSGGPSSDMSNYYKKSETYDITQIDNKLSAKLEERQLKTLTIGTGNPVSLVGTGTINIPIGGDSDSTITIEGLTEEAGDLRYLRKDSSTTQGISNITTSGGNLSILKDGGSGGDITAGGDITTQNGTISGKGLAGGTDGLTVTGGNVSVNKSGNNGGDITAGGKLQGATLKITGASDLDSTLSVGGKLTVESGGAEITGNTAVEGNLSVTGSTTLEGATTVDNTLHVTDAADFDSTVNIDGNLTGTNAQFTNASILNALTAKDITAETLTITKAAHFFELVIDELKSQKGAVIVTSANAKVIAVEQSQTDYGYNYICYYAAQDTNGSSITPPWEPGDLAICQSFNGVHTGTNSNISSKYYWARVTNLNFRKESAQDPRVWVKPPSNGSWITDGLTTYIKISDPSDNTFIPCYSFTLSFEYRNNAYTYDYNSTTGNESVATRPAAGDEVVQLGYIQSGLSPLTDNALKSRQSAIILSAYPTPDQGHGSDPQEEGYIAPLVPASLAFYQGIHTFELTPYRQTYIDANGAHFKGSFVTESGTIIDGSGGNANLDIYTLVANTPVIVKDNNNNFSPSTITIRFLHTTGEGSTLVDTIPTGYTLKSNGNTITNPSVTPNVNTNSYHFVLYNNSNNAAVAETIVNVFSADVTNGSDGSTTEFVYKQLAISATTPVLPTVSGAWSDSANGASGWSSNVPVYQGNTKIWLALRTISYTGSTPTYGSWQGPIALTGEVGADGANYEFIYGRFQTAQTWGNTIDNPAHWEASQTDDYTGPGSLWTDNPTGVSETYQYEYVSIRKKEGGVWGQFSTPALWSKWGEKGNDGDGVKYIFARINRSITPAAPVFQTGCPDIFAEGSYGVYEDSAEGKYYIKDTSNNRWYDDAIAPQKNGSSYYDVYCSMSKSSVPIGSTKSWIDFGKPALWSRYVEGGELYKLVGLKEVFEVQITSHDNYDTIVGAIACDLKYLVAHVVGDTVTYLDDSYLEAYQLRIELDNTSGENSFDLPEDESEAAGWDQDLEAGYFYFTYANLLTAIRPGTSGNAINYYSLLKGNSASQAYLPTKMTVTLTRDGKVLDARTVNLIFKPSHIFSVTEAALNSVYQGLNGDTTGSYTTGFSQIHQDWERINLSASNVQRLNSGEFPVSNEYQQYAYFLKDGNIPPSKPIGAISRTDTTSTAWTMGHPTPSEQYPYLFYSYRTRMYQSDTWTEWSNPVLFWEYDKDKELKIINTAALEVRADSIQSTVQQNVLDTVDGRGYQNATQVEQIANSIVSTATSTLTNQISTIQQESDKISLSVESLQAAGNLLDNAWVNQEATSSGKWWVKVEASRKISASSSEALPPETIDTDAIHNLALQYYSNSWESLTGIFNNQDVQSTFVSLMQTSPSSSRYNINGHVTLYSYLNTKAVEYSTDVLTFSVRIKRNIRAFPSGWSNGTFESTGNKSSFAIMFTGLNEIVDYAYSNQTPAQQAESHVTTVTSTIHIQWDITDDREHFLWVTFRLNSNLNKPTIGLRGHFGYTVSESDGIIYTASQWLLTEPKLEHSSKPTQWCERESWSSRTGIDIESGKITLDANTVAVAKDLTIGGNARVGGMVYNEQRVITPSDIHICKNPYDYGMITSTSLQTSSVYTTGNLLFPECGCNIKLTNNSIPEGLATQTDTVGSTKPYTQIKKINLSLPFYHSYIINNSSIASMSNMASLADGITNIPESTNSSTSADDCYKFLCGQIKNAGDICRRYLGTTVTIENAMSNEPIYVYGVKDIVSYGDVELDVTRTTGKYLYQFEPWSRSTIQWSFLARSNDNSSTYWDGSTIPSDKELYRLIEDVWFAHINKNNGAAINAAATIVTRSAVESSVQGPKIAINASQVVPTLMSGNLDFETFFGTNDSTDPYSFSQIISDNISYRVPFIIPEGWFCKLKLVFENGQFFWKVEALGALAS